MTERAAMHEEMMDICKSCTRTMGQRIKCVSQDSFSAKVASTTVMIVLESHAPRFGSFERNPFSSTSTRASWLSEKCQKRLYIEGQVPVHMITNSEYFFNI